MDNREKYLVSIITPLYNAENYIVECVSSVQNQSYNHWEMLIVDDQSSDSSYDIALGLAKKDSRLRVFQLPRNSGSGIARNKAIAEAKGRFIAFLDSDDIWHPEKLNRHVHFMIENKAKFSHTSYGYLDKNGQKIKNTFHVSRLPVTFYDLLKRPEISCLTAMYDAEVIGKFYMSKHKRKQDYALWLNILKSGYCSYGLDEELAYYRLHKGSATSNKFALLGKHVTFLQETQGLNTPTALYYTAYWIVNGIVKYFLK